MLRRWATAITGEVGVRCVCHQPKYFVGMILTLIFAGVMGLYGLIVALTLRTSAGTIDCFAVSIRHTPANAIGGLHSVLAPPPHSPPHTYTYTRAAAVPHATRLAKRYRGPGC